jgi:aminoglycoside phosphotransferase (APT) family kinase protein
VSDAVPIERPHIDAELVRRLVASQFPHWAALSIERLESAGTDNEIYRLGHDMAIRLPKVSWAIEHAKKELRWLPVLAPQLPLAVPVPLAAGEPGEGYPWNWAVCRWLDGDVADPDRLDNLTDAAMSLAGFVRALQQIDPAEGPRSGGHNSYRGVALVTRDSFTRTSIETLSDEIDTDAATMLWNATLALPTWDREPVWLHGDIHAGNLLATRGRLSAVIDFGLMGVGDPAVDLIVAWTLLSGPSRAAFREAVSADEATWLRGRGWAFSIAVVALAYYRHTNPTISAMSRVAIEQTLTDFELG